MNQLFQITRLLIIALLIGRSAALADPPVRVAQHKVSAAPFQQVRQQRQAAADAVRSVGFQRVWIQWESDQPQRVTGKFALRGSEILNFTRLGTAGDEVASVQQAGDEIDIFAAAAHTRGGFVFESDLTAETTLLFGLQGDQAAEDAAETQRIALASLGEQPLIIELPGALRVSAHVEPVPTKLIYPRNHLIFQPGEMFQFEALLDEVPTRANAQMRFTAKLTPARGGESLSEVVQEISTDALGQFQDLREFAIPLPETEGAYEIDLQIASVGGSRGGSILHSRRRVQLLVLEEGSPLTEVVDTTTWELLQEVDLEQLAAVDNSTRKSDADRGGRHTTTRAVRIEGADAGKPHVLELVCQGSEPAEYQVSVLQVDAGDANTMVESAFRIDERSGKVTNHQLVFWPGAGEVGIEVTRRSDSSQASATQVKVYAGPETLPAVNSRGVSGQRVVAAFLDSPEMGLRFGATQVQTPAAADLKDWQYYLDSTARQAQLLNNAGYSAAMITVAGGGGSIYPSNLIEPSVLFDNGEQFPDGGGSPRKDVLELLFQMYDRHQMVLIPTVRFDFPLAGLEAQILAGDHSLRLRNDQHETWWEASPTSPPQGPYYNPAHPDVQAAIRQIVQELVDGYSRHPSFGGVAVVIDEQTYLQFPGERWGCDPAAHDRAVALQKPEQRDAKADSLSDEELRSWRDVQLGLLLAGLGESLAANKSNHKLFVIDRTGQPTAAHRELRQAFTDSQTKLPGVVWIGDSEAGAGSTRQASGDVVDEEEQLLQPVRLAKQVGLLLSPERPVQVVGAAGRSDWIRQFAASDADWVVHPLPDLSLGQIEARRNLFTAIGALPSGRFEPADSSKTDDPTVMVRTAASTVARYGYVVNNSAWSTDVLIEFDDLDGAEVQTASDATTAALDENTWQVRVAPFDIVSFRVPKADVQIRDWSMQRDRVASKQMRQWLATLKRHLDAAKNLQLEEASLLPNADLSESDSNGQVVGWELARGAGMRLRLENDDSQSDKSLLILTEPPLGWPTPPIGWARSKPFAAPESGRMLCIARVRAEDDFATTRLKMVVSGQIGEQTYQESIWIDSSVPESVRDEHDIPTDTPYRQAGFQILEIPTERESSLQVRFEVHGGGRVWVDHVTIYDRFLTSEEIADLESRHDVALAGVESSEFGPYLQLKRSQESDRLLNQTPVVLAKTELPAGEAASGATASISDAGRSPATMAPGEVADASSQVPQLDRVPPGGSSRRTNAIAATRKTKASSQSQDRRASALAILDDLELGMIGSEPTAAPTRPQVFKPAKAVAPSKQSESRDQASDGKPEAKPSLGRRIVNWFRGDSDRDNPQPSPQKDREADGKKTERVSGFQIWNSRKR
ncbi:family 10 glycosylhydrolase [Rosistilla oblonga]|uniref:family 10 glycosylhydrolase n=1 Tax=Rosistilla oblonga TaxID=2527990 RepID=UPI003A97065C